jgi:hypothetical protein
MHEWSHILLGWGLGLSRHHRRQPRSVNKDGLYIYERAKEPKDPACPAIKSADIRVCAVKDDKPTYNKDP